MWLDLTKSPSWACLFPVHRCCMLGYHKGTHMLCQANAQRQAAVLMFLEIKLHDCALLSEMCKCVNYAKTDCQCKSKKWKIWCTLRRKGAGVWRVADVKGKLPRPHLGRFWKGSSVRSWRWKEAIIFFGTVPAGVEHVLSSWLAQERWVESVFSQSCLQDLFNFPSLPYSSRHATTTY